MDLLMEIKQARDNYRNLLATAALTQSEIALDECRLAKDKLGYLIRIAKEENIKGKVEFIAVESKYRRVI